VANIFQRIIQVSRILVGLLFILSGLIKANDTLGFSYKLDEYFGVFNIPWMSAISWPLATLMCVLEMLLGFMLLMGARLKFTLRMLLALCIFFGFLTWYSAYFEVVKECGCFGDAIKLSPWQSFYKDMILLVLILLLLIGKKHILPIFGEAAEKIILLLVVVACLAFPLYTYNYLPVVDFRDYAIGKNIPEQMKGVPDQLKFMYVLKDKKTGEQKEYDGWPVDWDKKYDYITNRPIVIKKGIEAKIKDLSVSRVPDGADYTEEILKYSGYNFILVAYDLDRSSDKNMGRINDLAALCIKDSIPFICLTASPAENIDAFKKKNNNIFDFYNSDGTVLKTMIRSNPGLILLKGGTVINQWHYNTIPSYNDVKVKYFNSKTGA